MPPKILISAGEASGDLYASRLVAALRTRGDFDFFGCTGPRLREEGVRTVVDAASLAVVGLVEVVGHIPRIYREFRKLVRAARAEQPALAILTDSPDFHLRLAAKLKRAGVPVIYLVAPQAWAWRKGRIPHMRRNIDRLLCIFPFEESFFRSHGVNAEFIGHPAAGRVAPQQSREDFLARHGLVEGEPVIALLPGSRQGELDRHLPVLVEAVERIRHGRKAQFVLALPRGGFSDRMSEASRGLVDRAGVVVTEGEAWDALAWSSVALAASGTVTVEGALLGTPMVTFYRVNPLSWWMGKHLVNVPFYSMVNLIAQKYVVPELMQDRMTPEAIAAEVEKLLDDPAVRARMKESLADVARSLTPSEEPIEKAAGISLKILSKRES